MVSIETLIAAGLTSGIPKFYPDRAPSGLHRTIL
jgi:hypothetical protein